MSRSVIVSTARTPFGKLGGGLAGYEAPELGAIAIKAALERAQIAPEQVEYVIMGEVLQAGVGQAPARQAAIGAGIPNPQARKHAVLAYRHHRGIARARCASRARLDDNLATECGAASSHALRTRATRQERRMQ